MQRLNSKIKSLKGLARITSALKKDGKRIVFTNGCFDLLHYGHAQYLQKAKDKGDVLIVAVNSDVSVRKIKGLTRPVVSQHNRLGLLAALESIDYLILFRELTPLKIIKALKPDILIKGADWKKSGIVGAAAVKAYGGRVLTIKLIKGLSTTNLIQKIIRAHA